MGGGGIGGLLFADDSLNGRKHHNITRGGKEEEMEEVNVYKYLGSQATKQ